MPGKANALGDSPTGYGWPSIALHWITATVIIVLLFVGSSIAMDGRMVHWHTTIAACAYPVLWARVIWRLRQGHPGPLPGQGGFFYGVGKLVHYVLLAALSVMLMSGPLLAWASGRAIEIFELAIPSPFGPSLSLTAFLLQVHGATAAVIVTCIALHVLGVFKHIAFNRDGTFDKMMRPAKQPLVTTAAAPESASGRIG